MLSFLTSLRMHPLTILLSYFFAWGWFDGLLQALPHETKAFQNLAADVLHRSLFGAHRQQQDVVLSKNRKVTFTRRLQRSLQEKEYKYDAGTWHNADGIDLEARFICAIGADDGVCPEPKWDDKGKGEIKRWEYNMEDNQCYGVSFGHRTWRGSAQACEDLGAKLVSIKSDSANTLVQNLCAEKLKEEGKDGGERPHLLEIVTDTCWIGLSREGSKTWTWEDGTVLGSPGSWNGYENFDGEEGHEHDIQDKVFIIPIDCSWEDGGWWIMIIILIVAIVGLIAWIIGQIIYTCQYKSKVTDQRPELPPADVLSSTNPSVVITHVQGFCNGGFKHGLCDMCSDCDMFCSVCWCLSTRNADTHATAKTGQTFWCVFVVFEIAFFIEQLINNIDVLVIGDTNPGWIVAGIIRCALMVGLRQQLRAKFGGPAAGQGCNDCIIWWCCGYCAACQEGRHVDEAQGKKVRCCCNMTDFQYFGFGGPVGHPMAVAQPIGQPGVITVVGQPVQGQAVAVGQPMAMATPVKGEDNPNKEYPQKVPQGTVVQPQVVQATPVMVQAVPVQAQAVPVQAQVVR